jgi:hypothetical protein
MIDAARTLWIGRIGLVSIVGNGEDVAEDLCVPGLGGCEEALLEELEVN